jgi:RNA polymerase sigma factor (sigma-70 family)
MTEANAVVCNLTITASTESLWERFCKGDQQALNTIYHAHIDDLYHYGMHFCRDAERVKDCLQDLFQCLWLDREHLSNDVKNIRYYLISSLRRRLLRSLEKTRRNYTEELGDTFDFKLIPPREEIIIQDEIYQQQVKQLQEGIAMLSRRQREAIYLRFYQNLSYDEIAKLMMMKVESVYNVISKAVGLLKNMFTLFLWMIALRP